MDILTSLDDFYKPENNYKLYKQYVLNLINETIDNFIQINKIFFNKKDNVFRFTNLVGETTDSGMIKDIELYLNINFQEKFKNLKIRIVNYKIKKLDDQNQLNIEITMSSNLLGAPKYLITNVYVRNNS